MIKKFRGINSHLDFSDEVPIWHGENWEPLDFLFKPRFDPRKIDGRACGLWRYREALPLDADSNPVSFGEGFTPMISTCLENGFRVFLKHDYLFPSGSYKDRGSTVLLSYLKEKGITRIVQDSSGNAGASVALYAALANIACDIYVPEKTEPAKLLQILASRARLIRVPGDRKETARQAFEAAKTSFYASHSYHPLFFQGTKTFAYEVAEQLGWKSPDHLVIPAGNGTLLLGCKLGFEELLEMGILDKMPVLHAVQSKACQPLKLVKENAGFNAETYQAGETLAEGIAIPNPIRLGQMLEAVNNTGGSVVTVDDEEIKSSWFWAAKNGKYIEPTSAATLAGLLKITMELSGEAVVVSTLTGSGLKAGEKIASMISAPAG